MLFFIGLFLNLLFLNLSPAAFELYSLDMIYSAKIMSLALPNIILVSLYSLFYIIASKIKLNSGVFLEIITLLYSGILYEAFIMLSCFSIIFFNFGDVILAKVNIEELNYFNYLIIGIYANLFGIYKALILMIFINNFIYYNSIKKQYKIEQSNL